MTRIMLTFLAVVYALPAQKIENETPARDRVVRVQTALNHLTVIEVAEPVTTVAVGSPDAFRVESRDNKVFIQPLEGNVSTNLFIWTATTRLNYELVPAISDAGRMDFAIDYRKPQHAAELRPRPQSVKPAAQSELPTEILLHSTPVKLVGFPRSRQPRVDVTVRDIYRAEDQVFIRYTIENRSQSPYEPSSPSVVALQSPQCDRSLMTLANSQLSDEYLSHLHYDGMVAMPIVHDDTPATYILPGASRVGVITVQLAKTRDAQPNSAPIVVRMVFPSDGPHQVIATLVL